MTRGKTVSRESQRDQSLREKVAPENSIFIGGVPEKRKRQKKKKNQLQPTVGGRKCFEIIDCPAGPPRQPFNGKNLRVPQLVYINVIVPFYEHVSDNGPYNIMDFDLNFAKKFYKIMTSHARLKKLTCDPVTSGRLYMVLRYFCERKNLSGNYLPADIVQLSEGKEEEISGILGVEYKTPKSLIEPVKVRKSEDRVIVATRSGDEGNVRRQLFNTMQFKKYMDKEGPMPKNRSRPRAGGVPFLGGKAASGKSQLSGSHGEWTNEDDVDSVSELFRQKHSAYTDMAVFFCQASSGDVCVNHIALYPFSMRLAKKINADGNDCNHCREAGRTVGYFLKTCRACYEQLFIDGKGEQDFCIPVKGVCEVHQVVWWRSLAHSMLTDLDKSQYKRLAVSSRCNQLNGTHGEATNEDDMSLKGMAESIDKALNRDGGKKDKNGGGQKRGNPKKKIDKPCRDYINGSCKYGDNCKFMHVDVEHKDDSSDQEEKCEKRQPQPKSWDGKADDFQKHQFILQYKQLDAAKEFALGILGSGNNTSSYGNVEDGVLVPGEDAYNLGTVVRCSRLDRNDVTDSAEHHGAFEATKNIVRREMNAANQYSVYSNNHTQRILSDGVLAKLNYLIANKDNLARIAEIEHEIQEVKVNGKKKIKKVLDDVNVYRVVPINPLDNPGVLDIVDEPYCCYVNGEKRFKTVFTQHASPEEVEYFNEPLTRAFLLEKRELFSWTKWVKSHWFFIVMSITIVYTITRSHAEFERDAEVAAVTGWRWFVWLFFPSGLKKTHDKLSVVTMVFCIVYWVWLRFFRNPAIFAEDSYTVLDGYPIPSKMVERFVSLEEGYRSISANIGSECLENVEFCRRHGYGRVREVFVNHKLVRVFVNHFSGKHITIELMRNERRAITGTYGKVFHYRLIDDCLDMAGQIASLHEYVSASRFSSASVPE